MYSTSYVNVINAFKSSNAVIFCLLSLAHDPICDTGIYTTCMQSFITGASVKQGNKETFIFLHADNAPVICNHCPPTYGE